jgi:hypothetical protein
MLHSIAVPYPINDATWLSAGRWSGTPQLEISNNAPASSTATESQHQ